MPERLGYPGNSKLLIIHADDFGMSSSGNKAGIMAMGKGMINSGSIMVPSPKFSEISNYARLNPETDFGVHLTLTCEWDAYKWGPISDPADVPRLVDSEGHFFSNKKDLLKNCTVAEIEKEFRAQINKAIEEGIDITHIDTHMFTAFSNKEIIRIYLALGKEYQLPVLLHYGIATIKNIRDKEVIVNELFIAQTDDYLNDLKKYYRNVLNSLKPGLNCILIHPAYDNKEMRGITLNILDYGAAWRQTDFDFFTSDECAQLIENNDIHLITWREIRDHVF
ncbi:polysaccharide deacetylase family protein [bacterium]|nr:polysaccharide deacetylase family protein [bacterium]